MSDWKGCMIRDCNAAPEASWLMCSAHIEDFGLRCPRDQKCNLGPNCTKPHDTITSSRRREALLWVDTYCKGNRVPGVVDALAALLERVAAETADIVGEGREEHLAEMGALRIENERLKAADEACKAQESQVYPAWLNELMDAGLAALDATRYAKGPWWSRLHAALHAVPVPRDQEDVAARDDLTAAREALADLHTLAHGHGSNVAANKAFMVVDAALDRYAALLSVGEEGSK